MLAEFFLTKPILEFTKFSTHEAWKRRGSGKGLFCVLVSKAVLAIFYPFSVRRLN